MSVVETRALGRTFEQRSGIVRRSKRTIEAVRGVDLTIERGELFGLLGPNGAGKTTTIKMLITLLLPTSGSAKVLGLDVVEDARRIRQRIGYVFGGDRGLYDRLSALDNLRYFAELYGLPPREQGRRIGELLELVGLTARGRDKVETFSRGMKQRLHIARGLLHDPELIFLDEPTTGIDPAGARELRLVIAGLIERGKTILLTTHYMFEADELCDRLAVIADGTIIAEGTSDQLKGMVGDGDITELEVFGLPAGVLERVRGVPGIRSVTVESRGPADLLVVQTAAGAQVTPAVLACLAETSVGRVSRREPTLEDAYLELVAPGGQS